MQHLVVQLDRLRVLVPAVALRRGRAGQFLLHVERRVDDAVARRLDHDIEIAAAQRLVPRARRHRPLGHLQSDLAPFVDQPGADVFVGLIDVAV